MRRIILLLLFVVPALTPAATLPRQGVIASANEQATAAGLEVLAQGGNAFDAAVAVSAALGLVEPESSGLGGGGFFLLHLASENRVVFVDARERAPMAATRDMYLDPQGNPRSGATVIGPLAAAIPGLPAGLDHVARHYGRLPLARSLAPAIRLAERGWRFGAKGRHGLAGKRDAIAANEAAAKLFLIRGELPRVGARLRNPDYAKTLRLLAREGAGGFYRGDYARRMVAAVRGGGGIWREQDLADYRVVEREPIRLQHRGYEIITAPPPSSGGIALGQMLQVLGGYDYPRLARVPRLHLVLESMRRAYRDRAIHLGDPDFVSIPVAQLLSPDYAAGLRASIHPHKALPSALLPGVDVAMERVDTTHFSIIDAEGNYAAVTQTINLPYGSAFVAPGTGFLLNNEMDDFSVKPGVPNEFGLVGAEANAIVPGKRPLSSMTPTFLVHPDRVAVIGTPGGSRIISMVLLATLSLMDGASAQDAVALRRVHHQYLPDIVYAEQGALSAAEQDALVQRGFTVEMAAETWGNMHVAVWDRRSGAVEVGLDPRWRGERERQDTSARGVIFR